MTDDKATRALAIQELVEAEVAVVKDHMKEFRHELQLAFKRRPRSPAGEEFRRIPPRTPFELEREAELQELGRMFRALLSEQQSAYRRIEYVHQESAKDHIKKAKARVLKITLVAGACLSLIVGATLAATVGYLVYGKSPLAMASDVMSAIEGKEQHALTATQQQLMASSEATSAQSSSQGDAAEAVTGHVTANEEGLVPPSQTVRTLVEAGAGIPVPEGVQPQASESDRSVATASHSPSGNPMVIPQPPMAVPPEGPLPSVMPTKSTLSNPAQARMPVPAGPTKKAASADGGTAAKAVASPPKSPVIASSGKTTTVEPPKVDAPVETIFAITPDIKRAPSAGQVREPSAAPIMGTQPNNSLDKAATAPTGSGAASSAVNAPAAKTSGEASKPVKAKFGDGGVTTLLPDAVVVIDPVKKTQSMVRVGQKLPDGTVIKSVDPRSGLVKTDRGDVIFD